MHSPLLLTCDDSVWPDFLGFNAATKALQNGRLLDALEARICAVEDTGLDSVGPSGIPDKDGKHTMDSAVMTGWNLLSASVGALEGFKNPFRVARIMWDRQKSGAFPHNFLVGAGADDFAKKNGAEVFSAIQAAASPFKTGNPAHDTVGCIGFDGTNWAVGTSTSGWGGKEPGRIGDAPVPGGGCYANAQGAAFCTWTGEVATRLTLAGRAMHAVESGMSLNEAVAFALRPLDLMADGHRGPVILHLATADGCAVVGAGFGNDVIPATYSYWRAGMDAPQRHPVPAWNPKLPVPVF